MGRVAGAQARAHGGGAVISRDYGDALGRLRRRPAGPTGPVKYVAASKGRPPSRRVGLATRSGLGSRVTPGSLFDAAASLPRGTQAVQMTVRGVPGRAWSVADLARYEEYQRTGRVTVSFTVRVLDLMRATLEMGATPERIVYDLGGYDIADVETVWLSPL